MFHLPDKLRVYSLIFSLPRLEDLCISISTAVTLDWPWDYETAACPSTPPPFTGTLELHRFRGIEHFIPQLLDLSKGVHFRKLDWSGSEWDAQQSSILLDACSTTLEDIDVRPTIRGTLHLRFCYDWHPTQTCISPRGPACIFDRLLESNETQKGITRV